MIGHGGLVGADQEICSVVELLLDTFTSVTSSGTVRDKSENEMTTLALIFSENGESLKEHVALDRSQWYLTSVCNLLL